MNKFHIFLASLSFYTLAIGTSFSDQWKMMQQEYRLLSEQFNTQDTNRFMHPYWQQQKQKMKALIEGKEDPNFLLKEPISGPMLRNEWSKTQDYEVVYLQHCIKDATRQFILPFHDVQFGGLTLKCNEFNCSINALGQLFFFTKLIERTKFENLNTIVELGGGYGCLARVVKMIKPDTTYIVFDLPEYLAIQSLYLRSTLTSKVIVHKKIPTDFEKGTIHLLPIFILPNITINADLFISTAALSETPETVQRMVIDKKFFNATSTYLTGQLNKWGVEYNFEHHKLIFDSMNSFYKLCFAQPLHHFGGPLNSYEIYGTNQEIK